MANKRSLNKVILIGNVGKDPEVRFITSLEKDIAKFTLATTEVFRDKNDQFKDITEWHNIVVWGKWTVKRVEKGVRKGTMVLVEGKLKTRKWEDKESKIMRSITEVHADDVVILKEATGKSNDIPAKGSDSDIDEVLKKDQQGPPPSYDIDSDVPHDESDPF